MSRSVRGPHAITYINIDMPHLYSTQSDHNYNHIARSYYRSSHAVQIVNTCYNLKIQIVILKSMVKVKVCSKQKLLILSLLTDYPVVRLLVCVTPRGCEGKKHTPVSLTSTHTHLSPVTAALGLLHSIDKWL